VKPTFLGLVSVSSFYVSCPSLAYTTEVAFMLLLISKLLMFGFIVHFARIMSYMF